MHEVVRFVTKHGYSVLFGAVFAHQLGVPVPGPLFLVAAGALAAAGKRPTCHFHWLWLPVSWVTCRGMKAGRRWGDRVLHFLHRLTRDPEAHDRRAKKMFGTYGSPILLVAKFVPGLDAVTPPLQPEPRARVGCIFLPLDALGAGLYSVAYAGLGYIFSDDLDWAAAYVGRAGRVLAALLFTACLAYGVRKLVRWHRHTRSLPVLRINSDDPA